MGIKSGGYNATMPEQRPFKYWALFAAIRRIIADVPYPAVIDVLDALLEPISEDSVTISGVRTPKRRTAP